MNPGRDVAASIELGDRTLAELMTPEDWLDLIRYYIGGRKTHYSLVRT